MKREELINDKAIELKGMVGLALSIDECIIFVNSVLASHPEPQPQEQETNEQLRCSNCGELIGNCDNSCWYRDRDELHEFKLGEQEKPQKPQITESEQEDITNAFCETRDENIKNNLQYRGRDYFQAGYDFAMSSQKHIPTDVLDILNCIAKFDRKECAMAKARYFDSVQRDIQKWLKEQIK